MSSKKRPSANSEATTASSKRSRTQSEDSPVPVVVKSEVIDEESSTLRTRFLDLFEKEPLGISNSTLKANFNDEEYKKLVPVINHLTQQSKLTMSKAGKELFYTLVSDDVASKFKGLDPKHRLVYQVIEKSERMGCWTKEIRIQTNIQQNMLAKILKVLENRRLVKQVKSVNAKSRKLYMLYDLEPSKQLTGGVWYSDLEFDHEFIAKMRSFLLHTIRRSSNGASVADLHQELVQKKVSNVELAPDDVRQLVQTMVFDYIVEESVEDSHGEMLYVLARRVSVPCEFQWWDALEPDFCFRAISFEDGVKLTAHESHFHTA